MRVTLIDNLLPVRAGPRLTVERTPHLGLMAIGTTLRHAGHAVDIFAPGQYFAYGAFGTIDDDFYVSCADKILALTPDVIGFTTIGTSFHHTLAIAQHVHKRAPHVPLCLGGPHSTILSEPILRKLPEFKAVLRYESETTVVPFLEALNAGADEINVPGAVWRQGTEIRKDPRLPQLISADALPEPALDFYPIERMEIGELPLEAGRGCPFDCTFCSTAQFFRRRHRLKSPERLVREIIGLRERYGITTFNLTHDLFGLHRKHVAAFAKAIAPHDVEWVCSTRLDCIDDQLVRTLARSGCRGLYFGIESGSARMQALIAKKLDVSKALDRLRTVPASGINCTVSFITGFPGERREDQAATLRLMGQMTALDPKHVTPQLHLLTPEPGSPLMDSGKNPIAFDWPPPNLPVAPSRELVKSSPEIFSSFCHFVTELPRARSVALVSMFTEWLRILGPEILAHLTLKTTRTLDRLLDAVVADPVPSMPPERVSAMAITALLGFLDTLPERSGYLRDVVRFTNAFALPPSASNGKQRAGKLANDAQLMRFERDPMPLVRSILARPAQLPKPRLRAAQPVDYLLFRNDDGHPAGWPLDRATSNTLRRYLETGNRQGCEDDELLKPLVRAGLLRQPEPA